jgi:DNA-binding GntR family transcriptional regulator
LLAGPRARDMLAVRPRLDVDVPGHTAVVEAVEAKDADAAEEAMVRLIKRGASPRR